MKRILPLAAVAGIILFAGGYFLIKSRTVEVYLQPAQVAESFKDKVRLSENSAITLMFVGDIMLDRGVKYMVEKYGSGDYRFPFLKIGSSLAEADILFGNLESIISDKGVKVGSIYSFRAEPAAMAGLVFAGFEGVSVANNHIFDYGRQAMEDSFLRLRESALDYIGGGFNELESYSPVIKEVKTTKIAFLAYTNLGSPHWAASGENSGIAWLDENRMTKDIKETKSQADLVIVFFHYGDEYQLEPNAFQVSISQAAIEAGADLVIGHHPHVIQPVEKYGEGYIAYSLGNFIFDQGFSEETLKGLILKVVVKKGKITELVPLEVKINKYFQPEIIQ